MEVTGIILAAGQSTRMGSANKLTKIWQGKPLVRHAFDAANNSGLDDLLVVSGHERADIAGVLPEARIVHNPVFETGMGSSISTGVKTVCKADGVMILLGDMPLVTAADINSLLAEFTKHPTGIVVATNSGDFGNPAIFGRPYFEKLMALNGDKGARQWLKNSDEVTGVEIGKAAIRDFDTPDKFEEG